MSDKADKTDDEMVLVRRDDLREALADAEAWDSDYGVGARPDLTRLRAAADGEACTPDESGN